MVRALILIPFLIALLSIVALIVAVVFLVRHLRASARAKRQDQLPHPNGDRFTPPV